MVGLFLTRENVGVPVEAAWRLKALLPTLKAAFEKYGSAPYKPLLKLVEEHAAEAKALTKVAECIMDTAFLGRTRELMATSSPDMYEFLAMMMMTACAASLISVRRKSLDDQVH